MEPPNPPLHLSNVVAGGNLLGCAGSLGRRCSGTLALGLGGRHVYLPVRSLGKATLSGRHRILDSFLNTKLHTYILVHTYMAVQSTCCTFAYYTPTTRDGARGLAKFALHISSAIGRAGKVYPKGVDGVLVRPTSASAARFSRRPHDCSRQTFVAVTGTKNNYGP